MTTFQEARAFLLKHRTEYETAVKGFRWPDPVPFNWALDWFDAELAANAQSKDRPALWIVDAAQDRQTKLSFAALSRRSNQVANFLRAQGLTRGDHLLLLLGNVVPLWETMLAAMKLGVVVIPATTLLTADELRDRLDRGKAKAVVAAQDQAKADGAGIAESAAGAVKGADVVVTMLPAGKHVLGVWGEVVPAMTKGALIIDSSTIDVESARQAHALAAKHGVLSVDAPVSGGTGGAKGATLTFMCGGEDKAFAAAKSVLENMGKKLVHCGGAGGGGGGQNFNKKIFGVFMIGGGGGLLLAGKIRVSH